MPSMRELTESVPNTAAAAAAAATTTENEEVNRARDDPKVKGAHCSYRRPEFCSQHLCWVTPNLF